ncbi:MAG: ATP-binding protein, partial [Ktedonobacteraceae bacterium]
VYVVTLEIVLSELEGCESLKQVSRTARRLGEILPHEAGLIDQRWVPPFTKLYEASLEAGRYSTSPGRQSQRDALNDMIDKLRQIYPRIAFDDANMNKRLQEIVKKWTQLAQQGLDKLGQFPEEAGYIENPYICGSALKPNNRLFVGRRTLVQQLEQALNRENQRLHIFLTGERRMGKTSTLNHLSTLLSTRYLPIILDLQSPDILSSTAAFLSKLANAIYTTMDARGARIRRLEHAFLQEAGRENEASCYHLFNEWLKDVEALLERNDQTLLIAFDEFEKLEMAGREHYLSLALLLNWIRSVIQNHSRMALLFSGVRTLADVNPDWPGYFVNVKTLKVTLLTPDDARTLITQPLPGFRGEDIFGEEGVDEIIRVSGCHPFLVQAICDELIETLNVERRKRACHADVMTAVENVLQSWSAYFQDLWVRTSAPQQACLIALKCLGRATISQIAQQCAFNEQKVQQTLQELQWRDLVLVENGCYRIAIPVFASWLHV